MQSSHTVVTGWPSQRTTHRHSNRGWVSKHSQYLGTGFWTTPVLTVQCDGTGAADMKQRQLILINAVDKSISLCSCLHVKVRQGNEECKVDITDMVTSPVNGQQRPTQLFLMVTDESPVCRCLADTAMSLVQAFFSQARWLHYAAAAAAAVSGDCVVYR